MSTGLYEQSHLPFETTHIDCGIDFVVGIPRTPMIQDIRVLPLTIPRHQHLPHLLAQQQLLQRTIACKAVVLQVRILIQRSLIAQ